MIADLYLCTHQSIIEFLTQSSELGIGIAGSYFTAELVRDIWHYLCHEVPFLWKHFHRYHHLCYGPDWAVKNKKLWQLNQTRHELSEAAVMAACSLGLSLKLAQTPSAALAIGSLYGVYYTLKKLVQVIGRIVAGKYPPDRDPFHTPGQYEHPPQTGIYLDREYHHCHHYGDVHSAYSGILKTFDLLFGTARSFKNKVIGIDTGDRLARAMAGEFARRGATRSIPLQDRSEVDYSELDILIVDACGGTAFDRARDFFESIQSNDDIAHKELWIAIPVGSEIAPRVSELDRGAPIIVRKVYLTSIASADWQAKLALFWASRDIRQIVA